MSLRRVLCPVWIGAASLAVLTGIASSTTTPRLQIVSVSFDGRVLVAGKINYLHVGPANLFTVMLRNGSRRQTKTAISLTLTPGFVGSRIHVAVGSLAPTTTKTVTGRVHQVAFAVRSTLTVWVSSTAGHLATVAYQVLFTLG